MTDGSWPRPGHNRGGVTLGFILFLSSTPGGAEDFF
nr:MAG TPA: hypothetical protein [Bacteriophage sp.]